MVKNKKALILLLVFLVFFNSPAYPKGKSIKYLPSSQDVETVSEDYDEDENVLGELPCPMPFSLSLSTSCAELFSSAKECNDCVDLEGECPDCCLTTSPKAIKCSPGASADYNCTNAPFEVNSCAPIECGLRSGDDASDCDTLVCSSGLVSSGSPYGRQRRGCPDADSDELAPSGCSGCTVSGTGKDRVWTCAKTSSCTPSSSPSFQTCSATSGTTTRANDTSCSPYYTVEYVWAYPAPVCTTTQSCNNQCNPTCSPTTPSCSSTLASCSSESCPATQNCPIPCTPPCWDQWVCPPPPPCPMPPCPPPPPCFKVTVCGSCTPTPCTATATCTTTPYIQSYVYRLNSTFKSCIDTCTTYADDYEECKDRVDCCEQAVCGSGYDDNCNDSSCNERLAVTTECYDSTAGQCARFNQAAEECLAANAGVCFREIDKNVRYDFTARTGEAYNVIWQINTTPLADAAEEGSNAKFFTMVKVWDPADSTIVYSSMLHQKSLNAAFSIYGKALIPKGTLAPGKNYQVQVHYFMNDNSGTGYEVEVKHMGLTVIRVRE